MTVQIVRFRSEMPAEEVMEIYEQRAPRYRAQDGLRQKYYLRYSGTEEHGAVYVWDSEEALEAFRSSELYRTIPEAYRVQGTPEITTAEVVMTLRA